MGEAERGEAAPRVWVTFYCANRHESRPSFATDVAVPDTWDCPRCGFPAGKDPENPPAPPRNEPYKTHLAYVKERRSDADGEAILEEALAKLRAERAAIQAAMQRVRN
ncbi:RNA polymerase-binding protein RbpA [Actinoallomurus purpureus]|nr:RNA polymerase-binding protein RbpA [Actinoallomurus purpureus]